MCMRFRCSPHIILPLILPFELSLFLPNSTIDRVRKHIIFPVLVGEPKSRIVQKHTFFAPERYTAGILYTGSLNSA